VFYRFVCCSLSVRKQQLFTLLFLLRNHLTLLYNYLKISFVDKDTHSQSKKIIYSVYIFLKQLSEKSDLTADFFKSAQVITAQA